jgi:formylglycine-generating enzyme required for sulfatase activity
MNRTGDAPVDPALQSVLRRLDSLPEGFGDIRDGVRKAVLIAELAREMGLTQARKVLELMLREVYERRCREPAGTRPLESLLQRLLKDGYLPARLDAYANAVRLLGNVGTHRFGEQVTAADVQQSLAQLLPVLEWYVAEERGAARPAAASREQAAGADATDGPVPGGRVAVVPKGLRSFDAGDARFFLKLLPGARDEHGLPESLRFWKRRIETALELPFTVGVLYGPSGCGKSSLVKAGLLPRLAGHVLAVYAEAAGDGTEARLLQGLRKRCPGLPVDADLVGTLAALRQGQGLQAGQKVLLVLDQFEQWLHASRPEADTELTRALRQCDGERVQALVLVRDDFWLAVSRFLGELHIELVQGHNSALVDLFDRRHARAVLAAFGRAFGTVAEPPAAEQAAFLDQAAEGLAEEGRVVPVRLALFADMVKGRPWTPGTLREVGGAAGVGVAFLEDTFSARTAPPKHRLHQQAARAVLRALLPEQGTDIKGQMQSRGKLREASGYAGREREFEELLRLLDGELRLLTPTEPPRAGTGGERYYQLTHDYLVPALREWLTRKQKETWRGRAEVRLGERAALWQTKPESRHLPAWWEWLDIRLLTRQKDWTPPQRKMMRKAGRFHLARSAGLAVVVAAAVLAGLFVWHQVSEQRRQDRADALVKRLLVADASQVPGIISEMGDYRPPVNPLLQQALAREPEHSAAHLHASLALLVEDPGQTEYLYNRMLHATPVGLPVISKVLGNRQELRQRLWGVVQDEHAVADERFRAACALAGYDPADGDAERWQAAAPFVAGRLLAAVQQDPAAYAAWLALLRPLGDRLAGPLGEAFRNRDQPDDARTAAGILADYAADQPELLAGLLLEADERQWAALWPKFAAHGQRAIALVQGALQQAMPPQDHVQARDRPAQRQAQAAVALLRLGQGDAVWPLLRHSPDPSRRTYLLHRLAPLGADPRRLLRRLAEEPDVSARRALILALGEFTAEQLPAEVHQPLSATLLAWYLDDPDPGTHAAIEWLLRHAKEGEVPRKLDWGQAEALARIDGALALLRDSAQVGAVLAAAPAGPLHLLPALCLGPEEGGRATEDADARRSWYVNSQGQTMVVRPGPVEFRMGSPAWEPARSRSEAQHLRKVPRSYALAAKPVTVAEFQRFLEASPKVKKQFDPIGQAADLLKRYSPAADGPIVTVNRHTAAAYCNWLSQEDGIPESEWVYPVGPGAIRPGMRMAAGYLGRTGYRLPTEAEWEYACRAGAVTSRSYGTAEEMLPRYAWYLQNAHERAWPVGQKKPNDFGLFDMHGNVSVWCQDRYGSYPEAGPDEAVEDGEDKDNTDAIIRLLRGGAFLVNAVDVRSANRSGYAPSNGISYFGFRPARTCR